MSRNLFLLISMPRRPFETDAERWVVYSIPTETAPVPKLWAEILAWTLSRDWQHMQCWHSQQFFIFAGEDEIRFEAFSCVILWFSLVRSQIPLFWFFSHPHHAYGASTRSVQICTGLEALEAHGLPKTGIKKDPRGVNLKTKSNYTRP